MNSSVLANSGGFVAESPRNLRGNRPGVVAVLFAIFLLIAGCGGSTKTATPTPAFTPGAGSYTSSQNVTVSDTNQNAVLYCTNDGSAPTASSPQCANPIKVSQSQTLNAIAIAPGMGVSAVATAAFTITGSSAAPTITGIGPATGSSAGGTSVTIVGTNFTGVTAVNFGTNQATSFTVNSSTSVTAVSPAGSGSVHITVIAAGGTSATTTADVFSYGTAPSITGLSPASATVGSVAITLTVSGTNFTSDADVQWNGASLTTTVVSSTQLTASVPASLLTAAGTATVTVKESSGASAGISFAINAAAPSIVGISPSQGPSLGGTTVTITGSNFTGVQAVKFGAVATTSFTVVSANNITAVSPGGSAGPVDIQVITPSGQSATGSNDQFTYLAPPTITAISPSAGKLAGGTTVTITGFNLTGATSVSFGSAAASGFSPISSTSITAVSPSGSAGTVDIRVVTPGGTSAISGADQFTFATAPIVTGVSPSAGPLAGGIAVTIKGENFTGATAVNFGSNSVVPGSISADGSSIIATSPSSGSAGTVDVTVTASGQTSTIIRPADEFTYAPLPTVGSVAPLTGSTGGGTTVTITGSNFAGTGYTVTAVNFGNNNPGTIVSVSPDGQTQTITATSPGGSAGPVNVTVVTPGGSATSATQFTYAPPPVVQSINPSSGPTTGGTTVTIEGTGFTNATEVDFGSNAVTTGLSVSSDGKSITVTTPAASSLGAVDIKVVTPIGTGTLTGGFTYEPAISGRVGSGTGISFAAIKQATVQLYAAGTTGYGAKPTPIDTTPSTVTADDNGDFSFVYSCPESSGGDQIYLVATGPDSGSPVWLMTALGTCGSLNPATTVTINEATTIASAFSLAQFASIATNGIDIGAPADTTTGPKCNTEGNWQSTGPNTCNYNGLKNAFATVQNLVDIPSGAALAITPAYKSKSVPGYNTSQVPQTRIYALANALASCANPTSSGCTDLFNATKVGSTAPVDTLQAALTIAQSPAVNVAAIYNQTSIIAPFTPSLTAAPSDWALAMVYQGAGLSGNSVQATGLAIDAQGNIWIPADIPSQISSGPSGGTGGLVAVFSNLGAPISPSATSSTDPGGYHGVVSGNNSIINPQSIAVDQQGYAWIGNYSSTSASTAGSITVLDANGNVKFGSPSGNSLLFLPRQGGIAVDAGGNVWVSSNVGSNDCNSGGGPWGGSILALSAATGTISPTGTIADYIPSGNDSCPTFLAIDQNSNMWTWDDGDFTTNDSVMGGALDLLSTADGGLVGGPYYNEGPFLPPNMAIDSAKNAWFSAVASTATGLGKMANMAGTAGSDPKVFRPAALSSSSVPFPSTVAIDGNSNAWIIGNGAGTVAGVAGLYEVSNDDSALLSPAAGFVGYDGNSLNPIGVGSLSSGTNSYATAVDSSGNVWIVSPIGLLSGGTQTVGGTLAEFVGIGAPAPTPLVSGLVGGNLGAKP